MPTNIGKAYEGAARQDRLRNTSLDIQPFHYVRKKHFFECRKQIIGERNVANVFGGRRPALGRVPCQLVSLPDH